MTLAHQVNWVQLVLLAAQASKVSQVTLDPLVSLALQDRKETWEAQDRQVNLDYLVQPE